MHETYPNEILELKKVNENEIQYHTPNKTIYLDQHF